ncbi:MAG: helix-turn-helix domain-containing protein [Clostridia bacterium]|nr:helix-turn-helix domain-containing protein [Clostridia bacterium]
MKNNYIKHKIENTINIPKIVTIHYFEFDKNYAFEGESHDFWEIIYVDKGFIRVTANKKEFTLSQGECCFHKPNEFHCHKADGVTAPNIFVISFVCNSDAMRFFRNKQIRIPLKLRPIISNIIDEGQKTFDLPFNNPDLRKLNLRKNSITGGQQMVRTYLEQLLILLLRYETSAGESNVFVTQDLMIEDIANRMKQKLDETAYSDIKVNDFCKEMKYSKAYLSKIFLKNFGYTINEYINKVKINEAKKLIRERQHNFAQIAEKLCFRDPLYFSKVFRRVTGMSPSEYKKSVKIN